MKNTKNNFPIGELNNSASPNKAATNEKELNIYNRKKALIKMVAVGALLIVMIIFGTISWFTQNREVSTSNMQIKTATMPFDIATKGSSVRNSEIIASKWNEYSTGTPISITENAEDVQYHTGDSIRLMFTPNEDDENTPDIDESEVPEIGPGSQGELNLYIIPKESGRVDAYIDLDITSYKVIKDENEDDQLIEITDNLTLASGLTDAQILDCQEAAQYLKGHILFFQGLSDTPSSYTYVKPVINGQIHFSIENAVAGKAYKVPIYWTWSNTLGQIALKTNAYSLRDPDGIPVVQETSNMGTSANPTDKALILSYLKNNKDIIFKDLDYVSGLTDEQKAVYNEIEDENDKADYLEAQTDVNTWIENADTEKYFDLLSDGYNAADFSIGSNLNYFLIELTVKSNE